VITVLYLWRIPRSRLPLAVLHMATDRRKLKGDSRVKFFKLLGTGTGDTFTPRDADPTLWGLLLTIDQDSLVSFDSDQVVSGWRKFSLSESRLVLSPISAHGKWSGVEPFEVDMNLAKEWTGQIAAVTRARIKWPENLKFWRSVPPVITSLRKAEGMLTAIGIGEAPIGLQGTFSIWRDRNAMQEFAYKGAEHAEVIRRTHARNWYAEELFAHFAILEARGEALTQR